MERSNDQRVTLDELAMILGSKDIEIFSLQKQLKAALEKLSELEGKPA